MKALMSVVMLALLLGLTYAASREVALLASDRECRHLGFDGSVIIGRFGRAQCEVFATGELVGIGVARQHPRPFGHQH